MEVGLFRIRAGGHVIEIDRARPLDRFILARHRSELTAATAAETEESKNETIQIMDALGSAGGRGERVHDRRLRWLARLPLRLPRLGVLDQRRLPRRMCLSQRRMRKLAQMLDDERLRGAGHLLQWTLRAPVHQQRQLQRG